MPKVTIIIPVYNGAKFLHKTLGCLINQTLKDIEIICVNDCSTDNSLEILKEYAEKDSRIKIIDREVNSGQSKNKNIALDAAQGECIMFLDQDDWYELDACELCYNQLTKNNNDVVMFDFNYYNPEKDEYTRDWARLQRVADSYISIKKPDIKFYELDSYFIESGYVWCYCYKREFLNKYNIRFIDKFKYADDLPFYVQTIINTSSFSIINKTLYTHLMSKNNTSFSRSDLYEELFNSRKICYKLIVKSEHSNNLLKPYLRYCIASITYWWKQYNINGVNRNILKQYYIQMHEMFEFFNKTYNIEEIKDNINYKFFKKVVEEDWETKCKKDFWKNLFSVGNSSTKTSKNIKILGYEFRIPIKMKFPKKTKNLKYIVAKPSRNAAIMATFNSKGLIPDNTIKYLKEIKKHFDYIIVVGDNPILESEAKKLDGIADSYIFKRHNNYDFGSYKIGYNTLKNFGIIDKIDKLLFFNDSVEFVGESLDDVFKNNYDFYGILKSNQPLKLNAIFAQHEHIQSWFLLMSSKIFKSDWFKKYIDSIKHQKYKRAYIINYEIGLGKLVSEHGFELNSYYPYNENYLINPDRIYAHPDKIIENRLFIKKRHLK